MKATTCDLASIGSRIRCARENFGFIRPGFSEKFGVSVRTLENNERGRNEPGASLFLPFAALGVNTNWLLTGEGQMLLADMKPAKSYAIDFQCLQKSIQAVEEGLSGSSKRFDPLKKAELILAVYDLFQEPSVSKENVLKLVRLAA